MLCLCCGPHRYWTRSSYNKLHQSAFVVYTLAQTGDVDASASLLPTEQHMCGSLCFYPLYPSSLHYRATQCSTDVWRANIQLFFCVQGSKFKHTFPSLSRPVIQARCWKKGWLKYSPRSDMTVGGVGWCGGRVVVRMGWGGWLWLFGHCVGPRKKNRRSGMVDERRGGYFEAVGLLKAEDWDRHRAV